MTSYYLKNGNCFRITDNLSLDLHDHLPAGNYIIRENPMTKELYLEMIDNFEFKGKRYGDNIRNTERIFNTFMDRTASTGVMLTGEKGSGKSLLAKCLSIKGYENGVPTVIVNQPWIGDTFNAFIQSIHQPCIVLFDEFEKVYDKDEQEQALTLFDGILLR